MTTPLETRLHALVADWREDADYFAGEGGDDQLAEIYYEKANELEALLDVRPPLHLTPRPPDKQPRSAIDVKRTL